jgi:hypothetical protein
VVAVVGGLVLAATLALGFGEVAGVAAAVLVAVPGVWLHHAAGTLDDLVALPAQLQSLRDGTPVVRASRHELRPSALRRSGPVAAARTVARTVADVSDALGPAASVVELAAPTFWIWTAVAALLAPVVALVALVALVLLLVA